MGKWLLGLCGVGLLLAAMLWWDSGSSAVSVSAQALVEARNDGSGARGLRIEAPGLGIPASLDEARAILDPELLQRASEGLEARIEADAGEGAAHVFLSEILRRKKSHRQAVVHGRRGAELLPTSSEAHWIYARALLLEAAHLGRSGGMGQLKAMKNIAPYKQEIRTAIELDPGLGEARKEEALFLIFAPLAGDLEQGTQLAQELEAIDPLEGGLCVARALSAQEDGLEPALSKAREVQAAYPLSQEPPWVLANLLHGAERHDEALEAIEQVLEGEKGETYYQALYLRARICNDRKEGLEAVLTDLEEWKVENSLWEWAPSEAQMECERGRALAGLGRVEESRIALERALELDPDSKRTQSGLIDLDSAR